MTLEELIEKDKSFNSSSFLSKANNMIKKTYNAVTLNQLETIKHFLSNEVFDYFQKEYEDAIKRDLHLVYDEVNVSCDIERILEEEEYYVIEVLAIIKYMKYYMSKDNQVVDGTNNNRLTTTKKVVFKKKKQGKENLYHRCVGCGFTLDVHNSGKCPHCGRVYDLDQFDYVIVSMK